MAHGPHEFVTALVYLFHNELSVIGEFHPVDAAQLPAAYRRLLAHPEHMTVSVEAFYGTRVVLEVLQKCRDDSHYSREILLRRVTDGAVVQYGIVRLDWTRLDEEVRRDILTECIPLGRTLIEHNVLREVEVLQLWQIYCGHRLTSLFGVENSRRTFGRSAIIHCNGEPAIELLEIVAPVPADLEATS